MRLLARALTGVCVPALFALAMWFTSVKPHLDGKVQNPLVTKGRIGAVTSNHVFSIKVTRVDVASGILRHGAGGDRRLRTPGVFVIVYLEARSDTKVVSLGHARLATRGGLSYAESGRSGTISLTAPFEPMLWRPARFVFEIPRNRLAGARFIVGEEKPIDDLSAETQIDLGLDAARAARLLVHPPADYALKQS